MATLYKFPDLARSINGKVVRHPKTGAEYLAICKDMLPTPDYEFILLAIMDEEYYNMADYKIQGVVTAYREFKV